MDYFLIIAGFFVGFIVGITGVGGGSLMTPILVLGFNISPAVAVGTDLIYAAVTKSGGVIVHHIHNNIKWRTVFLLFSGSIPSTIICVLFIKHLGNIGFDYNDLIMTTLSIALILTSLLILIHHQLKQFSNDKFFSLLTSFNQKFQYPITIFAGAIIGGLVTISSVGAGVIGAAVLLFLYPKYKTIQIVATDIAHAVPVTAIAGIGHAHIGNVDYNLLIHLIIGSLPGIYLGSRFGSLLPDKLLRSILAGLLLVIGVYLLFS